MKTYTIERYNKKIKRPQRIFTTFINKINKTNRVDIHFKDSNIININFSNISDFSLPGLITYFRDFYIEDICSNANRFNNELSLLQKKAFILLLPTLVYVINPILSVSEFREYDIPLILPKSYPMEARIVADVRNSIMNGTPIFILSRFINLSLKSDYRLSSSYTGFLNVFILFEIIYPNLIKDNSILRYIQDLDIIFWSQDDD
jgi:hypothetical protein